MSETSESKDGKELSNSFPKSPKASSMKVNTDSAKEMEDDRAFLQALQEYPDLRGKVMTFLKRKLEKQADDFQQELNLQKTKLIEDFTKQISKLQKRDKETQKLLQEYQAKHDKRMDSSHNSTRATSPNSVGTGSSNGDGYISQGGNSERSVATEYSNNATPRATCANCSHWKKQHDQLQHDHAQLQHQLAVLSLVHTDPSPMNMTTSHSPKHSEAYKQLQEQYFKQEQQFFTVQQRQLYHLEQITAQQTQMHALDTQHQKLLSQYQQLEKQYQHSQKKLAMFTPSSSSSSSSSSLMNATQFPKLVSNTSPDGHTNDSPTQVTASFSSSPSKSAQPPPKKLFQAFADSDSDEEGSSGAPSTEKPKAMATYYQGYTQVSTIIEEDNGTVSSKSTKTNSKAGGNSDEEDMFYVSSPSKERFPAYVQVKRDNKDLRHRILMNEQLVSGAGAGAGLNVISISGNSLGGNSLTPMVVAPSPTHHYQANQAGAGAAANEKPVMMSMQPRSKSLQFIPTTGNMNAGNGGQPTVMVAYPTHTTITFPSTTTSGNTSSTGSSGKYTVHKMNTITNNNTTNTMIRRK
jgi:hypothetical protein